MDKADFIQEKEFWIQLLGTLHVKELEEKFDEKMVVIEGLPCIDCNIQNLFDLADYTPYGKWQEQFQKITFCNFFCFFIEIALQYAHSEYPILFSKFLEPETVISNNVYQQIKNIPLRVLILEMNQCKRNGLLVGSNSEEEYTCFNQVMLGNSTYIKTITKAYPEMFRLLLLAITQSVQIMSEIVEQFCSEWIYIRKKIFSLDDCRYVPLIQSLELGLSDKHHEGKTVARIILDDGRTLIYKPHGLKKELLYQQLFHSFEKECGFLPGNYKILDCGTHGWEEYIQKEQCQSNEEAQNYYRRMGIHIFLCMLMDGTDMHMENILPRGEYPILLDLETLPGVYHLSSEESAEALAGEILDGSVIRSGILPIMVWGGEGAGINVSALSANNGQKLPFSSPYIANDKTSDMEIKYGRMLLNVQNNLPEIDGKVLMPLEYKDEIMAGFSEAYTVFLKNQVQMDRMIRRLYETKSRYLLRHTQQYTMYLSTSLHPQFMKDTKRRWLMLHTLKKDKKLTDRLGNNVIDSEIQSLMNLDIPFFEIDGETAALYDDKKRVAADYMKNTALEVYERRIRQMGPMDLKRQVMLMELSMALLGDTENRAAVNKRTVPADISETQVKYNIKIIVHQIADWLCDNAIVNKKRDDITWIGLHHFDENTWKITPVNKYLYDGLSGIAIFWALFVQKFPEEPYQEIYYLVQRTLFTYTDSVVDCKKYQSSRTGAFDGEGSMVNAYILLYHMTQDKIYLHYAEKHSEILWELFEQDTAYDYLSGNAGAIVVLIELYKLTSQQKYLRLAEKMEEYLWQRAIKTEHTAGWKIGNIPIPLAGKSHGNSGFIMAYASLLEITHEFHYKETIDQLLAYENSLYSDDLQNWLDLRNMNQNHPQCMNTWCHGAPGILLTRMKLAGLQEFKDNEQIAMDIKRAANALYEQKDLSGLCICHGMAGNYWIKRIYQKERGEDFAKCEEGEGKDLISKILENHKYLPQERYNPGLMTGVSGVGALLCDLL